MAPPPIARNKIEAAGGIDWLCEQLEAGQSKWAVAQRLGIAHGVLWAWINADQSRSARVIDSQIAGAEAYEHEADALLQTADTDIRDEDNRQIAGAIVAVARERAQVAWRRAAVRDPRRYNSSRTELTGPGGGPLQLQAVQARQLTSAELMQIAAQEKP